MSSEGKTQLLIASRRNRHEPLPSRCKQGKRTDRVSKQSVNSVPITTGTHRSRNQQNPKQLHRLPHLPLFQQPRRLPLPKPSQILRTVRFMRHMKAISLPTQRDGSGTRLLLESEQLYEQTNSSYLIEHMPASSITPLAWAGCWRIKQ